MAGSDHKRITVVVADDHLYQDGVVRARRKRRSRSSPKPPTGGRPWRRSGALPRRSAADYKLPGLDGLAITNAVVRERLPTRVLLLSAFTDSGCLQALETGAAGFISKEAAARNRRRSLAAARGEDVVPRQLHRAVSEIRLRKQDGRRR